MIRVSSQSIEARGYSWYKLWTDPLDPEALTKFGRRMGLKTEWIHSSTGAFVGPFPHFDLRGVAMKNRAIKMGAVETDFHEWVGQKMKEKKNGVRTAEDLL